MAPGRRRRRSTITPGLKKFTQPASTSPSERPASRTMRTAVASPARTSRTTSRLFAASTPGLGEPPRERARRPRPPRGSRRCRSGRRRPRGRRGGCGRCRPAAPCAPRWIARAGDDAAADAGADLDEHQVLGVAPVGPVLAEGHDVDVVVDEHRRVVAARRTSRGIEKPSQPGMIGGLTGWPVRTRPGRARRRRSRARRRRARPSSASSAVKCSSTTPRTRSGPAAMSMSNASSASGVPARSLAARRECVAPRSATSTTPARWLNVSSVGGRPPVEALPPAS